MSRRTYSGDDVMKVLVNHGPFYLDRIKGDHFILRWEPPDDHDSDARTVPVPRHDEVSTGTLKKIGEQAGMKEFQRFLDWLDRNL
ncbi:type II toxin-antitoxin system HicA family toxin [Halostagnicola bangensis]|uniref:Predicted RNA binding protein YcfA, dsRBD-like fold, HicA-like mRNA interferase family n=2 Tax=Halostagnicola kamekurae TaxID=619731 RepID=A0A1I6UYF0_9EURY|nr:Predicted RNA binding protein YcfA, dsRBD-like fold, HicA-like mRNA interferase family [Halostagnicola kamekurae]